MRADLAERAVGVLVMAGAEWNEEHEEVPGSRREAPPGRPNTAPAYYLGRPASVWLAAFRPTKR